MDKPTIEQILPLTPMQKGMLVLAYEASGSNRDDPYVIQSWGFLGRIDTNEVSSAQVLKSLETALQIVTDRHQALRSIFVTEGQSEPRQVILGNVKASFQFHDWSREVDPSRKFKNLLNADRERGFSLDRAPLFRLQVVRTANRWRFLFTHHHIIVDGWALGIIFDELQSLLRGAERSGLPVPVELGRIQKRFQNSNIQDLEPFWHSMLDGWSANPIKTGSFSKDRSGHTRTTREIPEEIVLSLGRAAQNWRLTQAELATAAWILCLKRFCRDEWITTGLTTSGRDNYPDALATIGMFANTLPLRVSCCSGALVSKFLGRVSTLMRDIIERDNTDLSDLQKFAGATMADPLFDTLIAFENIPGSSADNISIAFEDIQTEERTNLSAALVVVPGHEWKVSIQSRDDRIVPHLAATMCEEYVELLRLLCEANAESRIGELLDRRASEITKPIPFPARRLKNVNLVNAWFDTVTSNKKRVAARFNGNEILYDDLHQQAKSIAASLQFQGLNVGDRVAVKLNRDIDLLTVMLGIVIAGGCYVPIDPLQPDSRAKSILLDSEATLIITEETEKSLVERVGCLTLENLKSSDPAGFKPVIGLPSSAAAYMIFTSGSTGRPKGVTVSHENLLALLTSCEEPVGYKAGDVWSFFHSFSFDFSVWEIWGALLSGGTVLVVSFEDSRDPQKFVNLCRSEGVTILSQTPSAFHNFVQAEALTQKLLGLKSIVFGGEALKTQDLIHWCERHPLEETNLINMYGITETTVHVTAIRLSENDIVSGSLAPLGTPLKHLTLSLVDNEGRSIPTYSVGEIVVGGSGVASGYAGLPRLTAERFQPDPDALRPGARRYISGDLAILSPDGALLPLGRKDQQLKLRGFRIEAGEVEAALMQITGITGAVVGVYERGSTSEAGTGLCAHLTIQPNIVFKQGNVITELRAYLPDYMIPERFLVIDEFPLTTNGKIARDQLSNPYKDQHSKAINSVKSDDPLINKICEIWSAALAVPSVMPTDNYFSLGGDSIRSLKIISEAKKVGLTISVADLFQHPSPVDLALAMQGRKNNSSNPKTKEEVHPFYLLNADERANLTPDAIDAWPASRLQVGMIFHANMEDKLSYKGLYIDVFTYEIKQKGSSNALVQAFDGLVHKYPVLRSSFATASDRLLQIVSKSITPKLVLRDFRELDNAKQQLEITKLNEELSNEVPDFGAGNLFHVVACQLGEECWTLMFRFHHAILDGWSFAVLTSELFARWNDEQTQELEPIGGLSQQVNAQAILFEREFHAINNEALRKRWKKRLERLPEESLWSWPEEREHAEAGSVQIVVSNDTADQLKKLAQNTDIPLKSWLLACTGRVAAWASGSDDSVLGLITSCRPESEETAEAVGMFLNTLPISLTAAETWLQTAQQALAAEAEIIEDRMLPLSEIVRITGRRPFSITFNYVHFRPNEKASAHSVIDAQRSRERTDLDLAITFSLSPEGTRLSGEISFGEKISASQAQHIASALSDTIRLASNNYKGAANVPSHQPKLSISAAHAWKRSVHHCAIDSLAQTSEMPRVIEAMGTKYSGIEVLEKVAAAKTFFQTAQLSPGQGVVLNLPRGVDYLACVLAVGVMGGWTVAVDPDAPHSRIELVISDIPNAIVVSRDVNLSTGNQYHLGLDDLNQPSGKTSAEIVSEILNDAPSHPLLPAYAIYTSGSTGKPKGVVINHHNLSNHMDWMIQEFEFCGNDRFLFRTKPSFDASVWEIWAPLLTGAVLVIADDKSVLDGDALAELVQEEHITRLQLVPSLLDLFLMDLERTKLETLRTLFVGGEAFPTQLAKKAADFGNFEIVNLYGPTETTIHAATHRYDESQEFRGLPSIPIGKPVDGVDLSVETESGRSSAIGTLGSLFIGGTSVGQCYANLPRLTAERFLPDPERPGQRRFDSRDQVRILPDRTLLFVGREDDQVKLAGNRIELGEIEAALRVTLSNRRNSVLFESNAGLPRLVAYLESLPEDNIELDDLAIRAELSKRLPSYMIPSQFRFVRDWPILDSGKTDRKRLPELGEENKKQLLNVIEKDGERNSKLINALIEIAREQLGTTLMPKDDLFRHGADSIIVMQLVSRARSLGMFFNPRDVFSARTILNLSALVKTADQNSKVNQQGIAGLSPAQEWFFARNLVYPNWWNQVVALEILLPTTSGKFIEACKAIGNRHPAFGQRFDPSGLQDGSNPSPLVSIIKNTEEMQVSDEEWWAEVERVQAEEINITAGPLWAVVLECDDAERVTKAALIIHHLIVDGLSWRKIFDEIRDVLSGKTLDDEIPHSWIWLDPDREDIQGSQLPHWRLLADRLAKLEDISALSLESESIIQRLVLSEEFTQPLLKSDSDSLESMESSLCAAVLFALDALSKKGKQCIAVERHGRERLPVNSVDTIGWFTALWPIIHEPSADLAALRLDIGQQLHLIRDFDVDWLAACQLDNSLSLATEPFVIVNFLGTFTSSFNDGSFRPLPELKTAMRSPSNQRTSVLEISALIEQDKLIISISADRQFLKPWEIMKFADAIENALVDLSKLTPTVFNDHPLAAIDWPEQQLSGLIGLFNRDDETENILPLTPVQEGILFQQQRQDLIVGLYNQQLSMVIEGIDNEDELLSAFQRLVERHEALRTCFVSDDSGCQVQLVKKSAILPVTRIELPQNEVEARAKWLAVIADDQLIAFDENNPPLSRLTIGRQSSHWFVLWSHHHAILDGWSLPILLNELELPSERWASLPKPADRTPFWQWISKHRYPGLQKARSEAWRKRFAGMTQSTLLSDHLEQGIQVSKLDRCKIQINEDQLDLLHKLAQEAGVTTAAIVQAAFGIVLSSLTYQRDLAIGVVQSGRPPEILGANDWVGMFMNTLPLRITVTPSQSLAQWLGEIQEQILENQSAFSDRLADIQGWVGLGSLFDAIVIFQNYPLRGSAEYMENGSRIIDFSIDERNEFALSLYVTETDVLDFELSSGKQGPSEGMLEIIARSLQHVLHIWVQNPTQSVGSSSIISMEDLRRCEKFGGRKKIAAPHEFLWSSIEKVIARFPQKRAITDPASSSISYEELRQCISYVETRIKSANLAREEVVAVLGENGVTTIAAILACWRNGFAFMPIDPALPLQRVAMMFEAAKPSLLIDTRRDFSPLPGDIKVPTFRIEQSDLLNLDPEPGIRNNIQHAGTQLAYVMFTSGSTGRPKGVQVSRSALANAIFSFVSHPGIIDSDVLVSVTTPSFDISLAEMLCPLVVGAEIHILDDMSARDGRKIANILRDVKASVMQATPATWKLLVEEGAFPGLRAWSGGEALSADLKQHLTDTASGVWNFYGPTETTIWSAVGEMSDGDVHVGGPIAGTELLVADLNGHLVPPGAIGELLITGDGVSRGYRNDPRQTASVFTPIAGGARVYHTGDLARWVDGKLEILGRTDRQIKIMGHRIEPGEIETVLRRHPLIKDAAVGLTDDPRLIAWFVSKDGKEVLEVKEYLAGVLPAYMVPAVCHHIAEMPLTNNGKVDMTALLSYRPSKGVDSSSKILAEEDPFIRFVALTCALTINSQDFDPDQNFMTAGGHSLHLMQLRNRLEKLVGQSISLGDLFLAGTPRLMAEKIIADNPNAEAIRVSANAILEKLEKH